LSKKEMQLPTFLLGDNTDFPDDIFIVHLDFPRCILNLKNDDIELLEDVDDISEVELQTELSKLLESANAFYDREILRYDE
jgi:hypothetical protein